MAVDGPASPVRELPVVGLRISACLNNSSRVSSADLSEFWLEMTPLGALTSSKSFWVSAFGFPKSRTVLRLLKTFASCLGCSVPASAVSSAPASGVPLLSPVFRSVPASVFRSFLRYFVRSCFRNWGRTSAVSSGPANNFRPVLPPCFLQVYNQDSARPFPVTTYSYFLTSDTLTATMDPTIEQILAVSDRDFLHDVLKDLCQDSAMARQAVLEHFTAFPNDPSANNADTRGAAGGDQVSLVRS